MNLSIDLHNFSLVNVNFLDTKRNIIMDGNFTKIVYSNQYFTMNSIYLDFPIEWQNIERMSNKKFIRFNPYSPKNLTLIQDIAKIEARVLEYFRTYCNINVKIMNSLSKQMYSGNMKIFQEYGHPGYGDEDGPNDECLDKDCLHFVIKLSGIWENYQEIGITYKLLQQTSSPKVSRVD